MGKLLSDRDARRMEAMLRWYESRIDIRYQRRRRHGGGGGGREIHNAFCKAAAGAGSTIACYLDADLIAWASGTTYSKGDWVEVSGTDYKSLHDNNLGNAVTDAAWWESGTNTITVTIEIVGGSALNSALPRLEDGTRLSVWNDGGTWRNAGNPFQTSGDC